MGDRKVAIRSHLPLPNKREREREALRHPQPYNSFIYSFIRSFFHRNLSLSQAQGLPLAPILTKPEPSWTGTQTGAPRAFRNTARG